MTQIPRPRRDARFGTEDLGRLKRRPLHREKKEE